MVIRSALPEDARAIAEVHVSSWRTTYRGLLPESVLAAQSVEQRESGWRQITTEMLNGEIGSCVFVAEDLLVVSLALPMRVRSGRSGLVLTVSCMRFTWWSSVSALVLAGNL